MNNRDKGFSLIELITVMAIMAIIIGILAPQYMKYVVKSRKSVDVRTIDEISRAAILSATEEDIYESLDTGEYIITFMDGEYFGITGPASKSTDALKKGVESLVGELENITLQHTGWGTLQIHANVSTKKAMTITYTNDGLDSYEDYISSP